MTFFALVPAAGTGSRLGGSIPKQYREIAGRPLVWHAVNALLADTRIIRVDVLVAADDERIEKAMADFDDRVAVSRCGGTTRAATVAAGIASCKVAEDDIILVHDAARPCLHAADLKSLLDKMASGVQAALLAVPLAATVKRAQEQCSAETVDRSGLWEAQTPQAAVASLLRDASSDMPDATDEAQSLEKAGIHPVLVQAQHPNPKVTTSADLAVAQCLLGGASENG